MDTPSAPSIVDSHVHCMPDRLAGANRMLLGTDAPNMAISLESQLEWLAGLGLSEATREAVQGKNADRLVPR